MKIVLSCVGTLGDLHPYLVMAQVLQAEGHTVAIATHRHYQAEVEALGCQLIPQLPAEADLSPELLNKVHDPYLGPESIIRQLVLPYLRQNYQILVEQASDADLIISHLLTLAVPLFARKYQIPWLSCLLQPVALLSAYDPPVISQIYALRRLRRLGPGFHKPLFKLARQISASWWKDLAVFSKELGQQPIKNPLFEGGQSEWGTLLLFSEILASPQPDWPAAFFQLGFPFYQEPEAKLSEATRQFLARHSRPLVFTLGSSLGQSPTPFYRWAAEAAQALDLPALFVTAGHRESVPECHSDKIAVVDYEPYHLLFEQAGLIVHPGGIGTLSKALRSGQPQLVIPFANDQFDNAARVERLGAGVTVPIFKLNARRLKRAIQRALQLQPHPALQRQIRNEDFRLRLLKVVSYIQEVQSQTR